MHDISTRTLPPLIHDAIHTLCLAQEHLDDELKNQTRLTIMSLRKADTSDVQSAASILRQAASNLIDVETELCAADRLFTARKLRSIRERLEHLTAVTNG